MNKSIEGCSLSDDPGDQGRRQLTLYHGGVNAGDSMDVLHSVLGVW